jgi:sialate O-acetylesterase
MKRFNINFPRETSLIALPWYSNHIFLTRMKPSLALVVLLYSLHGITHAELRMPNVFGDKMVLQRDKPVKLWGWADTNQKVEATLGGQMLQTTADEKGQWALALKPMDANGKGQTLVVKAGKDTLAYEDVLIGEVWVCGGQSNMEWTLRSTRDADLEIQSADSPEIRFLRLPKVANLKAQDDFPVKSSGNPEENWRQAIPDQVENCTGVGYYFARRLNRVLKVPVGLVDVSWGGTMAQHWCSKKTLREIKEVDPYFEKFEAALNEWRKGGGAEGADKRYEADLKAYKEARAKWEEKKEGRAPRGPNAKAYSDPAGKGQPGGMFNGMIIPIAKLSIRGVLFYQGENNSFTVGWKPFYRTFPSVISDWRKAFGNNELPFGIVQIAGWSNRRGMTYDMNHHCNVIREIQHIVWQGTSKTGLIATYDTNSNGSIHPGRKLPVGERSARWALAEVYGFKTDGGRKDLEWMGPVYESHSIEGGKVVINFKEETRRGLRLDQDVEVGFYVAGEDQVFHEARARVDGGKGTVIVWHDEIPKPVAVRYAFSNLPMGGLMNARELPAYPFRTDDWPITPHQSTGSYLVKEAFGKK